jgi:regulator-associated protein of mTOR
LLLLCSDFVLCAIVLFSLFVCSAVAVAVFRFCSRSLLTHLRPELVDRIPGRLADRKTPLGELNWIFTAITDTIAWDTLPRGRTGHDRTHTDTE